MFFLTFIHIDIMEKKKRGRPKQNAGADEDESVAPAIIQQVCIVHYDASSFDNFKLLADVKNQQERIQKILEIRDLRLSQPANSTHRMESVCIYRLKSATVMGIIVTAIIISQRMWKGLRVQKIPSQKKYPEKYREK